MKTNKKKLKKKTHSVLFGVYTWREREIVNERIDRRRMFLKT